MDEDLEGDPTPEGEEGELGADLYGDLPDFRYDVTLDQLRASVAKLEAENHLLQTRLGKLSEEKKFLDLNYSALIKTAKLEIRRKERTISDLRDQLNTLRKKPSLKRNRGMTASPSPKKKPKIYSEKTREERYPRRVLQNRISSKAKVSDQDERCNPVRKAERGREVSEKENAPLKGPLEEKEPRLSGNHAARCVVPDEPRPERAPSSLPAIECPTLFSDRMYKRIYGSSPEKANNKFSTSKKIQFAAVEEQPDSSKSRERGRLTTPNVGSLNQHTSSNLCKHVTPEDIRTYLGVENPSDSESSSCSSAQLSLCQSKPSATSYVIPQTCDNSTSVSKLELLVHQEPAVAPFSFPSVRSNFIEDGSPQINAGNSSMVARTEPQKPPEPVHPLPAIEILSVPSAAETPKINAGRSHAKSHGASVNSLPTVNPRQLATIRPIQKLAVQGIPAVANESEKSSLGLNASTENLNDSKPTEMNLGVGSAEKPTRPLKIPGLPGSAKGRTIRQVFAPISSQWNCTLPTASYQKDGDRKGGSELSVVQTVSVTSELTVRVDDSKFDGLRRQTLTEAVFGSPVKWADDSLDSPTVEGSTNSQKAIFYSIFGSPLKSVDSNSSEQPFSVPPGAYEESCWTNQIPEKGQKSPLDAQLQKQSQRSQEPGTLTETKANKKSSDPSEAEKVAIISPACPPPSSSVIKKHVSVFSPVKDSKISNHPPDDLSRSNTGIFFPFPKPKYEDSILGQFDDTAQFVSAVASNFQVHSEISPLSTPVKSEEHLQSVIVKNNPTSFEEVFNKTVPERAQPSRESSNYINGPDGTIVTENSNCPVLSKGLSDEKDPAETPICSMLTDHCSDEKTELGKENTPGCCLQDPKPLRVVEPPSIIINSPNSESGHYDGPFRIIIHRPNLASSTKSFFVKSWFPKGTPAKLVTPRKTPRLVTRVSPSAAPKPSASIDYAIVFDQEDRLRSASGSPMKSINGSPTRKKHELSGKGSMKKRSPKKQASPSRSPRPAEVCKNLLSSYSGVSTLISKNDSHAESAPHQLNPGSANQPGTFSSSFNSNNCETKVTPGTLDLSIGSAVFQVKEKTSVVDPSKCTDLSGSESPCGSILKNEIASLQVPKVNQGKPCPNTIFQSNSVPSTSCCPHSASWFPEGVPINMVTPRKDASSLRNKSDPVAIDPSLATIKDVADAPLNLEIARNSFPPADESSPVPVDPTLSCKRHIADDPGIMVTPPNDTSSLVKPDALPIDPTIDLKKVIADTNCKGPVGQTEPSSNSPNATNAQIPLNSACAKRLPEVKTSTKGRTIAKAMDLVPSKTTDFSDRFARNPPPSGNPTIKRVTRSSYASIIKRVKTSSPLNMSVAALVTSSVNPSRLRPTVATPQSAKKSNFKRSSALKPDAKTGTGNTLMDSIKSTFFQATPTSSKANEYGDQTQTPKPRLIRSKSAHNSSVTSVRPSVSVKSAKHNPVTPSHTKAYPAAGRAASERVPSRERAVPSAQGRPRVAADGLSQRDVASRRGRAESVGEGLLKKPAEPVELERNFPGQWKLLEVDRPCKSFSLLQRFKEDHTLRGPLAPEQEGKSVTRTESSTSAVQPDKPQQKGSKSNEVEPVQITSHLKRGVGKTSMEKPANTVISKTHGATDPLGNTEPPPKSSVFPKSCSRKTILLDVPLKMEIPTRKRKMSGDSIESPFKSKEDPVRPVSGKMSSRRTSGDHRLVFEAKSSEMTRELKTGGTGRHVCQREIIEKSSPEKSSKRGTEPKTPLAGRRSNLETSPVRSGRKNAEPDRHWSSRREKVEVTSPDMPDRRYTEPERRVQHRRVHSFKAPLPSALERPVEPRHRVQLHRKSIHTDLRARYFRRSRSVSIGVSSRRLRAIKHDVTPKKQEKMSRSSHSGSTPSRKPELSTKCSLESQTSSSDPDADERSQSIKTQVMKSHEKSLHTDTKPIISCSVSSPTRSKFAISESVSGTEIVSPGTSDRTSKIISPKSFCKQSKPQLSELTDRQSKAVACDFASNPSKFDSGESNKTISDTAKNKPADQVPSAVPQPQVPPWARSGKRRVKVIGVHMQSCETPSFSEFSRSAKIITSTPRIQQDVTPNPKSQALPR